MTTAAMKSESDRHVLVLGSTGFIGKHVVGRLARSGYRVHALSHSESDEVNDGVEHVRGSMHDLPLIRDLVGRCRYVVHAASLTTPSVSASSPSLEVSGNLDALAQLVSLAEEFPERRLVYLSSAGAVYGDVSGIADENTATRPKSYYGAGKAAAEAFIHACTTSSSWRASIVRPSNIYGAGQQMRKGFAIIPTLFWHAAMGTTFEIWGDGQSVRDYCHVDDLVDLVCRAIDQGSDARCLVCNAASGETASVLALIEACESVSGHRIDVAFRPARSIDAPYVSLNTRSAETAYSWKARISLTEGLQQTWRSFSQDIALRAANRP